MSRAWDFLTRDRPKTLPLRVLASGVASLVIGVVDLFYGERSFGEVPLGIAVVLMIVALWLSRGRSPRWLSSSDEARALRSRLSKIAYWVFAVVLIVVGILTGFSIGLPLLLLGVTLAATASVRGRPRLFWPIVAGVVGLIAGFVLTAPLGCSTSATTMTHGASMVWTHCNSLLFLYGGGEGYRPSFAPALFFGVSTAIAAGAVTRVVVDRPGRR